ncbi:MAG: BatD family protein [Brevinema sp.]
MRIFILLFLLQMPIFGITPKTRIEVNPPFIGTNETAEIIVTAIDEEFLEPPQPSLQSPDFDIAYLNSSVVNRMTIINGRANREKLFHYVYQLVPKNTGKFVVPAFVGLTRNKKEVYTDSAEIEIKAVDFLQAANQNSSFGGLFSIFQNVPREVFLFWKLSTNQTAQNSGIIADLYIYSDVPQFLKQTHYLKEVQRAAYDGGVLHELPVNEDEKKIDSGYFGSRIFYGQLQKRFAVYPLKTGTTSLRAPVMIMEQQLGSAYIQGEAAEIRSRSLTSNPSYVGDTLSVEISLSSNKITSSGEGQLNLVLKGDGHTDFFTNPFRNLKIDGLFISEPSSKLEISLDETKNIIMTKTFTYTIIPNRSDHFKIPSVEFSYIKKNKGKGKVKTPEIEFEGILHNTKIKSNTPEDLKKQESVKHYYYYSSGLWMMVFAILLGFGMLAYSWWQVQFKKRMQTDQKFARANQANSKMSELIRESHEAFDKKNYKDAARLLRHSLISYCIDKFGLEQNVNPEDIAYVLAQKHGEFPSKEFISLLKALEFHAFASAPTKSEMQKYLEQGNHFLNIITDKKK